MSETSVTVNQEPTIFLNTPEGQIVQPFDENVKVLLVGKALTPREKIPQSLKMSAMSLPTYIINRGNAITTDMSLLTIDDSKLGFNLIEDISDLLSHTVWATIKPSEELNMVLNAFKRVYEAKDLWKTIRNMRHLVFNADDLLSKLSDLHVKLSQQTDNKFDTAGNSRNSKAITVSGNAPLLIEFNLPLLSGVATKTIIPCDITVEPSNNGALFTVDTYMLDHTSYMEIKKYFDHIVGVLKDSPDIHCNIVHV